MLVPWAYKWHEKKREQTGGVKSGSTGGVETGREGCFIIDTIAAIETQETTLFLPLECGTSTCCKLVVVVVCLVAVWSFKSASHLTQPASPADICRLSINIVILTIIIVIIITIILIITSSSSLWALCQRLSILPCETNFSLFLLLLQPLLLLLRSFNRCHPSTSKSASLTPDSTVFPHSYFPSTLYYVVQIFIVFPPNTFLQFGPLRERN